MLDMQELGWEMMGRSRPGCRSVVCELVFPETTAPCSQTLPKSKWNPTRGPSRHSAPTASGQAPRFYVHCAFYGSSYIPKYQSFPQTPSRAETRTLSPSPPPLSISPAWGFSSPRTCFRPWPARPGLPKRCTFTFTWNVSSRAQDLHVCLHICQ